MARGYPDARSTTPGGTLVLHVASDAARIRFDLFRQGPTLSYAGSSPWFDGPAPEGSPSANIDFGWTPFSFVVPGGWSSGVHVAAIAEWDGNGQPPLVIAPIPTFATDGLLLFVLRSADPGSNATTPYCPESAT